MIWGLVLTFASAGCGLFDRSRREGGGDAARRDRRLDEGRELARDGQMAEAAEAFEDAVYADPESAEAHFLLARALLELGRTYPALDELRAAERLRPDHGPQRVMMGQVNTHLGRLEEAEEVLQEAVTRWPDDPRAHFALGVLRMRQDRLNDAELSLIRAARSAPRLPGLQEMLGRTLLRLGRADQAVTRFEEAIRQRECDDLAHGGLAASLVVTSQPGQGQAEMQRAIDCADPEHAGPWYAGLALAYAASSQYRDALENLDRGARMFRPALLEALRWRLEAAQGGWSAVGCRAHTVTCARAEEKLWSGALLLFVVGAPDAAARELSEAISIYDGDPVTHWIMAEALAELDRLDEVGLELDRASTWEPSAQVRAAMDDLRERMSE
jgi:tetratricopeptide (TPR) repeat protein